MKMLLVLKYELITLLRKPGYLILAFGFPIVSLLVLAGINLARSGPQAQDLADNEPQQLEVEGFVDRAGLIGELPVEIPEGTLIEFPIEEQAREALSEERITAYYVVPSDYLASGELIYVHPSLNPLATDRQDWIMRRTLLFNLVGADAELADWISDPVALEEIDLSALEAGLDGDCARPGMDCEANPWIGRMPMLVMVFFFIVLTNGSALLIRSVSGEKQNRLIEILASSIDPLQLMAGKILGLGIGTLLGFAAWVAAAVAALRVSQPNLPVEFEVPGLLLPWAIVFFLLGFTLYASLMAGIGALVPNVKETTKASWIVMGPMLVGYMIGLFSIERPNGALMTALSLFPVTSPLNMVQRLTTGQVPGWQPVLAAALLGAAVFLAMKIAARLFRAHHLLSGQPFSPKILIGALRD
ncbi:MAG: ABC transporter permease [Anaerolineae bacterium]|nr:MAG: ABC transporter permease [Anaerolineae bacterium]